MKHTTSLNTLKAKVTGTDRVVEVYRLKLGHPTAAHTWHIYLGDKISSEAISQGLHNETFTNEQLQFI
jgi:hypothetical protein